MEFCYSWETLASVRRLKTVTFFPLLPVKYSSSL